MLKFNVHTSPKLARFLRRQSLTLLVGWSVLIFILSSIPGNKYPQVQWEHADKLTHIGLYFWGGLLAALYYCGKGKTVLAAFAYSALYGMSDELHQLVVPRRSFSLMDWGADCFGAILGIAVYLSISSSKLSKPQLFNPVDNSRERMKTT